MKPSFVTRHLATVEAPDGTAFVTVPDPDLFTHERPGEALDLAAARCAIDAVRASGARRLVLVSTAAVLNPAAARYRYARTAAAIERLALGADALETVIVRPACLWGPGDEAFLPGILHAVRGRHYVWIDGGRYQFSTCHVRNACEGALLVAERGVPGQAYAVADTETTTFRLFVKGLLGAHGVSEPALTVPSALAGPAAAGLDRLWTTARMRRAAPITREILALYGMAVTVDDSVARQALGYVGRVSRGEGIAELSPGWRGDGV